MCDPSLTDASGRSSEFREELEPWREVDVTDVEEKMRGLKMEQEADFSEPEQVKLVQPVLVADQSSALPPSTSTSSQAVDDSLLVSGDGGSLPASGDGGSLPTSGDVLSMLQMRRRRSLLRRLHPVLRKRLMT